MSYIDEYRDMRIQCKTRLFESVVRQTVQVIVGFYLYLTLTNLILNLHFFFTAKKHKFRRKFNFLLIPKEENFCLLYLQFCLIL